ncbi:MAG: hypothetical protein Q4D51_00190 [Eubacteriales bacterium]|nr:hypothetical protein [Eubacteriales bacterium]
MNRKKNYNEYHFRAKDWIIFGLMGLGKIAIIAYLFFDSLKAIFFILPLIGIDYKSMKKEKIEEQKQSFTKQFRSMMEAIVTSLNAGYSLEYSFVDARRDLQLIYSEKEDIFREIDLFLEGIKMNMPVEELMKDLGKRSGVQDIKNFANVILVAKRNGGNLMHIIDKTVKNIIDKASVEEEIKTMIAAKKLEEKIMMVMPYGIIFYLRMTSGELLQVLYHNLLGVVLMATFLLMIYLADFWAKKIMEIRV